MASKEKIIEMLGAGIKPVQVALACGVTDSYVSQLLENPDILAQVQELMTKNAVKHVEHDTTLDTLEDRSLKKIEQLLPLVMKPMEALAVFKTLNAARRRAPIANGDTAPQGNFVTIDLPEAANVHFKITTDRQVIEVEGRSMLPMQSKGVQKLLESHRTKRLLESSLEAPLKLPTPSLLDQI